MAAVVGLLVGVTSLVDWLGKTLDDPEPPPPREIDTRLTSLRIRSPRVPQEQFLRETNQPLAGASKAELRELGITFSVRVRLKGVIGKTFPLRVSLYDADSGELLRDEIFTNEQVAFTPSSPNQARTVPIWMPYPDRPGTYFARGTLIDEKRQPVDERDSDPFDVAKVPKLE